MHDPWQFYRGIVGKLPFYFLALVLIEPKQFPERKIEHPKLYG